MRRRWLRRARRTACAAAIAAAIAWAAAPYAFERLDRRFPFPIAELNAPISGHVYASDGRPLGRKVAPDEQWRRPVSYGDLGRWLPLATLAIEDVRFRSHAGVDAKAIARATWRNLRALGVREGASTITMQLVGMALRSPRTFPGKAVEAFRALQLEDAFTKDEILAMYLNRAPYGGNVTGAAMAASAWFGKDPIDLSLDEAALLAGLPQAPSRLRPDRHPERARARRLRVLDRMLEEGWIEPAAHADAAEAPLPTALWARSPSTRANDVDGAPHAASWALQRRPAGGTLLIDPAKQRLLVGLAQRHREFLPDSADIAIALIRVADAALVGHVGSADPSDPLDGQVDGARARRSPGSSLKPFLFAAAFESGALSPESLVSNAALEVDGWAPTNFDGGDGGDVSVADALRRSLNLPAIRAAQRAGLPRCIGVLEAAGIPLGDGVLDEAGLALVTGAVRVRLIDLATGYATLARQGLFLPTRTFTDEPQRAPSRALEASTCEALYRILSDEARAPHVRGGASHVGGAGFMWKTGTSSGHRDAVAAGHSRDYAAAVWVGRFSGSGHPSFTGSQCAEPILAELFAELSQAAGGDAPTER